MKPSYLFLTFVMCICLFACNKKDNGDNSTPTPNNGSNVSIQNFAFNTATITVQKGTTITWTNNDTAPHTVTADDNSYTSNNLNQGDSYSHIYTTAGTFTYHCKIHTMMTGTVVVQ